MVAIIKIPNLPPDSTKERLAQKHVPKIALRGEGESGKLLVDYTEPIVPWAI